MADNKDIEKAVKVLKANRTKYEKPVKYYDGEHDLRFATEKFLNAFGILFRTFALNLCPAVCDAVRDKLTLTGFRVEQGEKSIPEDAWKIWQENRMGVRSRQIHRESLVAGDAYAIVWVDPDKKTTIYPNKAESCMVVYDEETPGKILWGAKYWFTLPDAQGKKKARMNLLYPDRIEKYITARNTDGDLPDKATGWVEVTDDAGAGAVIRNPYGVVPIFHFGNNADIGSFGKSEISQAIPVQDALNKSVLDMLVAMEFAAYRQRWAAGIEIEYDDEGKPIPPFTAGIERLWVTESQEAKFGDFDAANLEQFLKVKDGFRVDMAAVTGTPLYYFMQTGAQFPSGESLKKAETRFVNKVNDRQESFGQVWENLMSLALRIEGKSNIRLFTEWEDPAPLSENEMLTNLGLKQQLGIPEEQLWTEAGYGEADIKKMAQAKAEAEEEAIRKFNAGEDLGADE